MSRQTTIVSAPGKVLIAGGYLVLDRAYRGLVIATSSRFYCAIRPSPTSSTKDVDAGIITVRAGQFPEEASTWSYTVRSTEWGIEVKALDAEKRNKFVEITLRNALQVIAEDAACGGILDIAAVEVVRRIRETGGLSVTVLAHNDFYSQRESLHNLSIPPLYSSLDSLPPFNLLPRPIHQTNKTGLGSSAALVTSLTAALLAHFGTISITSSSSSEKDRELVHNLSQFSHCLAQGKVGSGFDISSAVFGSHIYRRFSPSVLTPLMDGTPSALLSCLKDGGWDHETVSCSLPRGLRLMLADVDAGTDTPSFVSQVLKWRASQPDEADELWNELGEANETLGGHLRDLTRLAGQDGYDASLQIAASDKVRELDTSDAVLSLLVKTASTFQNIRRLLRDMSTASNVLIEPPEQTRLLDTCVSLPGVIGGAVPGAGGYDAIFLLVIDTPQVVSSVETVWSEWKEMSVCPLSAKQSDGGLQSESLEQVTGLRERLGW